MVWKSKKGNSQTSSPDRSHMAGPPQTQFMLGRKWVQISPQDICGLIWTHFRPNMNCVCGGPAMWDLSGELVWEFPFFDFQTMRLLPEGRYGADYDKYDFTAPWSLSVK